MPDANEGMEDREDEGYITLSLPEEVLVGLPDTIRTAIAELPYVLGKEAPEELEKLESGHCLVCASQMGAETAMLSDGNGILYLVCNPICLDDMVIFGWLSEKAKDIMETVQFRNESRDEKPQTN